MRVDRRLLLRAEERFRPYQGNGREEVKRKVRMKTNIIKTTLIACAAVALAFTAKAADQTMKGAEHLLHLQGIKTKAQADALKPGDTMAMVCTKCKSVIVHNITT